ncbi:MAG: IS66 family insertion sequence element accessory protein TnpB [Methylovirgula sp.]|uniref:IS66 family insertion sequence element accessory protein TnpB n=1 Tax=Methylovirgula sp. TaxID=1978224 RepID=UPI0030764549
MIPSGVKVFLASHPIDFRKGMDGLLSLVRDAGSDPFDGALYVFRAKRADRIKIVFWTGPGLFFMRSAWRQRSSAGRRSGIIGFTSIRRRLMALVDGMDWKRVHAVTVKPPEFCWGKSLRQSESRRPKMRATGVKICSDPRHAGAGFRSPRQC